MRDFFSKHSYLIIWLASLIIIGAVAALILQLNGYSIPTNTTLNQPTAAPAPITPPAPSVTLTIYKNGKKESLLVAWQNLPADTTALNIWRASTNSSSTAQFWQSISISESQLSDGNASIDLGSSGGNYSYYVEAVGGGGNGSSTGNTSSTEEILWISSSTIPIVSTSTIPGSGGGQNSGDNGGNGSSTTGTENQTSTNQSPDNGNGGGNNASSSGSGSGGVNSSSSGNGSGPESNLYYNPEIQVTGHGVDSGNFWVEHMDQSIEMGWQNLPAGTDNILVSRSESQDGPWSQILQEENPGSNGSYSLELVDGTVNDPYYYNLTALSGTTTLATYGPVYLAPQGQ